MKSNIRKIGALLLAGVIAFSFSACETESGASSDNISSKEAGSHSVSSIVASNSSSESSENLTVSTNVSNASGETSATTNLEIFNVEKDFEYIDITMDEADELFGKLLEVSEKEDEMWGKYISRRYEDALCEFMEDDLGTSKIRIRSMEISSSGYAPVRDIQVGDSLESVLDKFPNEKEESYVDGNGYIISPLYGVYQHGQNFGYVLHDKDKPIKLVFCDIGDEIEQWWWALTLEVDNKSLINTIKLYRTD